jgi:hypothetical protein
MYVFDQKPYRHVAVPIFVPIFICTGIYPKIIVLISKAKTVPVPVAFVLEPNFIRQIYMVQ